MTSDAGTLLLRHTDRAIGLFDRLAACFADLRDPYLTVHSVRSMIGQRICAIALGYEDIDDHNNLLHDPLLGLVLEGLGCKRSDCAPLCRQVDLEPAEAWLAR